MSWDVEYTDDFGRWWSGLSEGEQESLDASVRLLEERGPNLGFPHSSGINGSGHKVHMPIADGLYDEHLEQLRKEGLINGQ
jgi:hypothetical protein